MLPLRHGDSARSIHPVTCSFGAPPAQQKLTVEFVSKSAKVLELHTESVSYTHDVFYFRKMITE